MKIAFTADWHIRGKDLAAARAQLLQLVAKIKKREIGTIVIAGDVFENPNIFDQNASAGAQIKVAQETITRLTKFAEHVIILRGNHDQSGPGSADALHVFDPFLNHPTCDVDIIRNCQALKIGHFYLACLPWEWGAINGAAADVNDLIRHCQTEDPNRPMILTGHVQVGGAKMNGGYNCEQKKRSWSLSRSDLEAWPFQHVALGDFHARQDLTGGRGGYIGALRQCNFGEEGNPAGFEIYDTHYLETEWVKLDAAPILRTVVIQPDEKALPRLENEKRRVQIVGGHVDHVAVKALEEAGDTVEHIIEVEERVRRADVPPGILQDPRALMRLWAEQQDPPITEERIERMFLLFDAIQADAPREEVTA